MAQPFRWGILGPGRIARKFASSLPYSNGGVLHAVASTEMARAEAFAKEFEAGHAYGSYHELLDHAEVDAVYIATPNVSHFSNAIQALERRIPVLCEKPLTNSLQETEELIRFAQKQETFLMEGLWSVFLPHFQQAHAWVQDGEIGEVLHCQADFGFAAIQDLENRQFNPALGGGVLKDIGVYPLAFFMKMVSLPSELQGIVRRAMNGTDAHVAFQGQTAYGTTFQSLVTFGMATPTVASIFGTKGRIVFDKQWLRPVGVTLFKEEEEIRFYPKVEGFGFQYEADEVMKCIRSGENKSEMWGHTDSISLAHSVDVLMQF